MSLVDLLLNSFHVSSYDVYVGNNIFGTLFAICMLIALIEYTKQNPRTGKNISYTLVFGSLFLLLLVLF